MLFAYTKKGVGGPPEIFFVSWVYPLFAMDLYEYPKISMDMRGYSCGVTQGQPWLSQSTLDVVVILSGIRKCTLDVLVI